MDGGTEYRKAAARSRKRPPKRSAAGGEEDGSRPGTLGPAKKSGRAQGEKQEIAEGSGRGAHVPWQDQPKTEEKEAERMAAQRVKAKEKVKEKVTKDSAKL